MGKRINTLLEGFDVVTTAALTSTLSDVTSTNRGRIVAVDVVSFPQGFIFATNFTLQVGAQNLLETVATTDYDVVSFPGNYKIIPVEINDGQTFNLTVQNPIAQVGIAHSVIFIREGAQISYDRNSKLNSYKLSTDLGANIAVLQNFDGTIPKNRGKCIGFSVIYDNSGLGGGATVPTTTFRINGVELIKNVTCNVLTPGSTRAYTTLYLPLETGSTWELDIVNTAGFNLHPFVTFYFEKD